MAMHKKKGMARGGKTNNKMKKKGMARGGKMPKKMAMGGKMTMMKKGYAMGGKTGGMTLGNIRAAAKAKGYKLIKG